MPPACYPVRAALSRLRPRRGRRQRPSLEDRGPLPPRHLRARLRPRHHPRAPRAAPPAPRASLRSGPRRQPVADLPFSEFTQRIEEPAASSPCPTPWPAVAAARRPAGVLPPLPQRLDLPASACPTPTAACPPKYAEIPQSLSTSAATSARSARSTTASSLPPAATASGSSISTSRTSASSSRRCCASRPPAASKRSNC